MNQNQNLDHDQASTTRDGSTAAPPELDTPRPRLNLLLWRADPSLRHQWWLVALVTLLMMVIVLAALGLVDRLSEAKRQIQAEITIQIPASTQGGTAGGNSTEVDQVFNELEQTPGIDTIRLLSLADVRDILRPWVGENAQLDGLPVPYVLAVSRQLGRDAAPVDIRQLQGRLEQISTGIVVDDHAQSLNDIKRIHRIALISALGCCALLSVLVAAIILIAVNTALRMQRQVLDVLFLAGASDRFIAGQFAQFAFGFSLRGLLVGSLISLAAYRFAVPWIAPDWTGGPWLGFSHLQLGASFIVPTLILILITITVYQLSSRRLAELY